MRRHPLLAAVSVALLLGAASPALADPGNGHAYGKNHGKGQPNKPAKTPKDKADRVNGGGTTANGAEFSINARQGRARNSHFNYTKPGGLKVRCRNVTLAPVAEATPLTANVTSDKCFIWGPNGTRTKVSLTASFVDNGATGDVANISFTGQTPDNGAITSGQINVRR